MSAVLNPARELLGRMPEPGLEAVLTAIRLGMVPPEAAVPTLAGWPLLVLDDPDPAAVRPMLLEAGPDRVVVAAFTSPDRIGSHRDPDRRLRFLTGHRIAVGAAPGVGIVVNPGSEPSLTIAPDVVAELRELPEAGVAHSPGSRELTPLEQAVVAVNAGLGSVDAVVDELRDADVTVVSATDPGSDGVRPAFESGGGNPRLLVWSHPGLVRDVPGRVWAVAVKGGDLRALVGRPTAVLLNAGTGLQLEVPAVG